MRFVAGLSASVAKQTVAVGQLIAVNPAAAPTAAGVLHVEPSTVLMKLEPLVTAKHAVVVGQLTELRVAVVLDV
jgi:hypothetical protein